MWAEYGDGGNDAETSVQALLPRENRKNSQLRQDSRKDYPEESPKAKKEMKEKDLETLKQSQHKLTKKQLALIPEAEQYMYLKM